MKLVKRSSEFILICFSFIIITSCNKEKLDEDKLVKLYVENLIVEETYFNKADSLKIKKDELFKKYGLSKKEFEGQLINMGNDKIKWESFFNKSRLLLEDLRKSGAVN